MISVFNQSYLERFHYCMTPPLELCRWLVLSMLLRRRRAWINDPSYITHSIPFMFRRAKHLIQRLVSNY